MPKFELEIDDKGQDFVGAVPAELAAILDRVRTTAHGEGFGKGNQKAAEEAKKQIEASVAAEKAKWEAQLPIERAKWSDIEATNAHLKTQVDGLVQQHRKTLTEQAETHAQEITRRVERENKRDARIKDLVSHSLRALAGQNGAREESLTELEVILQHRIGYDDEMLPYVKGEDGQPMKTTAGNAVPLEVFVKQYLDNHPHHRKPAQGRGGDARSGATLRQPAGANTTVQQVQTRIENGDRSASAINELFEASRRKAS